MKLKNVVRMDFWLPIDHDGEVIFTSKSGEDKSIKTSGGGDLCIDLDGEDISGDVLDTYDEEFSYEFDEPVNVEASGGSYAGIECTTVKTKKKPTRKVVKKPIRKKTKGVVKKPVRKVTKKIVKKPKNRVVKKRNIVKRHTSKKRRG